MLHCPLEFHVVYGSVAILVPNGEEPVQYAGFRLEAEACEAVVSRSSPAPPAPRLTAADEALRRRRLAARIACCAMLRLPDTGPIDKPAGGSNVCTACNVNFERSPTCNVDTLYSLQRQLRNDCRVALRSLSDHVPKQTKPTPSPTTRCVIRRDNSRNEEPRGASTSTITRESTQGYRLWMPPSRDSPTLLASDSAIAPSAVVHTIDSFLTNVAEEFGAYQRRHYAIVGSAWISVAIATLSMVVTGKAPQWHPYGDPKFAHNISTEPPPCGEGQDFVLVNTWESTTGEWSLVCEAAGLAALLSTLFFVGFGVGALGLGSAADRFGRRPTCQLAASISALGSALSALAQTPQTYALCRLVAGIGTGGLSTASYVLATEIIGPSWQGVTGVGMSGIFSTGALLLVPISLLLPAWRGVNACAALCSMLNLLLFRFVDESPRWLHANGQSDRAALILQLVAIGNGHQCPSPPKLAPPGGHAPTLCSGCTSSSSSPPPGSSAATFDAVSQATSDAAAATLPPTEAPSIGALFSSRVMRWRTIGMVYCWFAASFSYYGLSLNSGNLGGSLLLNFGLSSVVELPSYAMAVVMLGRLGRRATLALGFGVGGVGCVACLALPPGAPTVLAATVGKFCDRRLAASSSTRANSSRPCCDLPPWACARRLRVWAAP